MLILNRPWNCRKLIDNWKPPPRIRKSFYNHMEISAKESILRMALYLLKHARSPANFGLAHCQMIKRKFPGQIFTKFKIEFQRHFVSFGHLPSANFRLPTWHLFDTFGKEMNKVQCGRHCESENQFPLLSSRHSKDLFVKLGQLKNAKCNLRI